MDTRFKEVDFEKYCKICKYYDKAENEDPCWDCLNEPANEHSQRPVNFKENRDKIKKGKI